MDGNASKWWQAYKLTNGMGTWEQFVQAIQEKFGSFDYKHAIDGLIELQQTGSVRDYVDEFEALKFQITMHDVGMAETNLENEHAVCKPPVPYVGVVSELLNEKHHNDIVWDDEFLQIPDLDNSLLQQLAHGVDDQMQCKNVYPMLFEHDAELEYDEMFG
jgi:hypothetical protein